MTDLSTTFAGLNLKNPIIAASSGLTRNLRKIKEIAEAGVGAIVLKSLFEEQIEGQGALLLGNTDYPEAYDYISTYVKNDELGKYLEFVKQVKATVKVPVIASINCYKLDTWVDFASQIAKSGVDALEINVMKLETDLFFDPIAEEQGYIDIVQKLKSTVHIPIIMKLSKNHTALVSMIDKLAAAGLNGVTLFNRSYQTDIDINKIEMTSGNVFTTAHDISDTLRYTGIVSGMVPELPVASSTGVHSWEEVVKCLLAGAACVQMCSTIYANGPKAIRDGLDGLKIWMEKKGYRSIDEFKGKLNSANIPSQTVYERMQFMKYFSSKEV